MTLLGVVSIYAWIPPGIAWPLAYFAVTLAIASAQ